ncbi:MAG: hypothetical protein KF830_04280 [Planctomycetes bacterium]|nr:hypothetical protein [Planctomycetota bacterium]
MRTLLSLASLLLLVALAACSGGELVGIHVHLQTDGSGLVTLRALAEPGAAGAAEARTQGVTWKGRAGLTCSQGSFPQIEGLKLGNGGIRFLADLGDQRPNLRVFLQRGPDAEWVKALAPDLAARQAMAKIYDPTGRTREIGDVLRLEVSVPGQVFASGVRPTGRGVEAGHEGKRAYLLLPVRTALETGDEFEWSFSW